MLREPLLEQSALPGGVSAGLHPTFLGAEGKQMGGYEKTRATKLFSSRLAKYETNWE